MQIAHAKLDAGQAWTDAMRMLKSGREILLTIAGFFIMLPSLLLNALRPFRAGPGENWIAAIGAWTEANFIWILLVAVLAALGRLVILILLLGPGRPTVGEALAAAIKLLPIFVLMDLLIGFMLLGTSFLIFPALYIFGRTFLAEAAFVTNRARGPFAGLASGFEASRGNGWRLLLMAAIIYVAGVILTAAIRSVAGVVGILAGAGLDLFLGVFVDAVCGAGISLLLLLVAVASWRQLADQRNVRSGLAE